MQLNMIRITYFFVSSITHAILYDMIFFFIPSHMQLNLHIIYFFVSSIFDFASVMGMQRQFNAITRIRDLV